MHENIPDPEWVMLGGRDRSQKLVVASTRLGGVEMQPHSRLVRINPLHGDDLLNIREELDGVTITVRVYEYVWSAGETYAGAIHGAMTFWRPDDRPTSPQSWERAAAPVREQLRRPRLT